MDLSKTIELFKEHNLLKVIDEPLDIDLEIPHISYIEVKKPDSKALLFTKPICKRLNKEFSEPILTNTFGSFKALELIFGKDPDEVAKKIESLLKMKPPRSFKEKISALSGLYGLKSVIPQRLKTKGICQEVVVENPDLNDLPALITWPKDGGAFLTMAHTYTISLDGSVQNVGMYRLQIYDDKRLGMHWQIHKDGAHFFHEYKKAGKKMPVTVAIGGDPLYIWCGQAPLPNGIFELLLYGLIRDKSPKLVKSLTNDIYIPEDVDYVIEGFVDPEKFELEGPFGDHTGYYNLEEPYPFMEVTKITRRVKPIFHATVVGKPPLEDKYMGYATGRVFLPLLKTTTPDLIDYLMPENGVFHNLILAKMKSRYIGHAKQFMHAFWGVGQMSFVKNAIFLGEDAPKLEDSKKVAKYILNRLSVDSLLISEGVCDALDHTSIKPCYGGKLGIDCTNEELDLKNQKEKIEESELYDRIKSKIPELKSLAIYFEDSFNPIAVLGVEKSKNGRDFYETLPKDLSKYLGVIVWVDASKNDVFNPYMLVWRVSNNVDAKRDIFLENGIIGVDGTNKGPIDKHFREWPDDTDCDQEVIANLRKRGLISVNEEFLKQYHV